MMRFLFSLTSGYVCLLRISIVYAIELNISDAGSIKNAAASVAYDMMSYYTGNQTNGSASVGLLPQPYYWWEAGAMWGANMLWEKICAGDIPGQLDDLLLVIDYWYYTGDTSYNDVVAQALLSQVSPTNDFMMPAQHFDLGNDDQVFWALSAMAAAEYNFPNPSALSWIELAKNVFDDLNSRWNVTTCNGGLKWQIYSTNVGYGYKSTITNTGFFQLSARLARYTGNTTYLETNEKVWNWMTGVGLISNGYNVYDGTDDTINCSSVNHDQWTYNNAALIYGTAMLANVSADTTPWLNRTIGFLNAAKSLFFSPYFNATNVMFEAECEQPNTCDVDQFSFKAYLSRWLYGSAKLLPQLENTIIDIMVPTALAAAQSCSGGSNDRSCGTRWWYGGWDGAMGLGQQMAALEAIHGLLINTVDAPSIAPIKSSAII